MLSKHEQEILNEKYYRFQDIDVNDRKYYLDIIKNCKDICDTEQEVDGCRTCQIVEMLFKKIGNRVVVNGSLTVGEKIKENRTIEADMYLDNGKVIVDMLITRLCTLDNIKKYRVLDEFSIIDNKLQRRSQYNYDMKSIYTNIDNNEMKGRLK